MVTMEKERQEILDKTRIALLYDFYGTLLTDKANESLSLYLNEDWTISEIASTLSISRQAVHDSLQRSLEHLERYEASLGLLEQHERLNDIADALEDAWKNNNREEAQKQLRALRENL